MVTDRYNAREAEPRWQRVWDERGIFATPRDALSTPASGNGAAAGEARPKYYVLEMFPYPSGRIHMGHVRNYTMGDVVARVKRAKGFSVLHPMGWDAFGMPAENAAMERKVHPRAWTYQNIAQMKSQLKSMGLSLDWAREIATCDPAYYRHQQKMFLDFLGAGLVERKLGKVNWDPVDRTVLANEQVIDGRGWRSGALVEQREMPQWYFRITKYSDDLLAALDTLERWPEKVRTMQKNWIGRSEGLLVRFALDPETTPAGERELEVFTTRPDTLFGAKFMALAPDHPLAAAAAAKNPALAEFIAECKRHGTAAEIIETAEKQGFDTGIRAVHPFDPTWQLPVYVANFILMDYGTGAIFGCPAHDQRDLDFPINQFRGTQTFITSLLTDTHPIRNRRDADNWLARLEAFGPLLDQESKTMADRARQGIRPPSFIIKETVAQMQRFITPPPEKNIIATAFAGKLQKASIEGAPQLNAAALKLLTSSLYPTYRRALDSLSTVGAKATPEAGLRRLPHGLDAYAFYLRRFTTTNLTAEQIHQKGLDEVKRIESEMEALLKPLGYTTGTIADRYKKLSADHVYPDTPPCPRPDPRRLPAND